MDSSGKKTEDIRTQLRDLIKQMLQEALESELEEYLGYPKNKPPKDKSTKPFNVRNGYSTKTVKSDSGEVEPEVLRDRNSEFEPQIVKRRQSVLDDLEDKIVALYSKGMRTRNIQDILEGMYGVDLSPPLISRLTYRMLPRLEEWQLRSLGAAYAVIYMAWLYFLQGKGRGKGFK